MKLVKFSATTCNPCHVLGMMLDDMSVTVDESFFLTLKKFVMKLWRNLM